MKYAACCTKKAPIRSVGLPKSALADRYNVLLFFYGAKVILAYSAHRAYIVIG